MSVQHRPLCRVRSTDPPRSSSRQLYDHNIIIQARIQVGIDEEEVPHRDSKLLPMTAESFFEDEVDKYGWSGKLGLLLAGTRDEHSPLSALRDHESTILREIYSYTANQFARHVKLTIPASLVGSKGDGGDFLFTFEQRNDDTYTSSILRAMPTKSSGFRNAFVSFATCGFVAFPEPADRNVNMMPFVFGDRISLPHHLQCYFPLIEACPYMADDVGKVGFLTVQESHVAAGETQRREGLHIESPATFSTNKNTASFTPAIEHHWGTGLFWGPDRYEGGIYMASNVSNTCQVWDAIVNKNVPGIVDEHGGCEHLRPLIGDGRKLQAGELVWMTDCTPHEALPQQGNEMRQFFRVITPNVSQWFVDHSTENPKVSLPPNITIVKGNKFRKTKS